MKDRLGSALVKPEHYDSHNFSKIINQYLKHIDPKINFSHLNAFFRRIYETEPLNRSDQLSSFSVESTGTNDKKLKFQIFVKPGEQKIDIYDDVTSLFAIHHDDYKMKDGSSPKTGNIDGKTAMLMIAQSHTDPSTLGINQKLLLDQPKFYATVHILNSSSVALPVEGSAEPKEHISVYRDHSKWSVNVIYGVEGPFPAVLCFYDLNRSNKQIERGGGAFCLNSTLTGTTAASMLLWGMFMSFQPTPTDMARFTDSNVGLILKQVLPKNEVSEFDNFSINADLGFQLKSDSSSRSKSRKKSRLTESISHGMPLIEYMGDGIGSNNSIKVYSLKDILSVDLKCPYRFRKAELSVKRNTNENVPTLTVLQIFNSVYRYSFDKINEALRKYKLIISYVRDDTLITPAKDANHLATYIADSDVKVSCCKATSSSKRKREESEEVESDIKGLSTERESSISGNKTVKELENDLIFNPMRKLNAVFKKVDSFAKNKGKLVNKTSIESDSDFSSSDSQN